MAIKAVIFDLDGTITHTLPLCVRAFRAAIEPLAGRSVSDQEIIATFGPSEEGTIKALVPEHYDQGLADYLAAYERLIEPAYGPFPGMVNWLADLDRSPTRVALVTGKGPGSTAITLARFGLKDYFEHVAVGSPEGPVKADRIREIVGRWDLPPGEVLYVGDAPSDVAAARAAGVRMMSVTWSPEAETTEEGLRSLNPDIVVKTIGEARNWIHAWNGDSMTRLGQRVQAIAQTGLAFTKDRFDIERYEALREIGAELLAGSKSEQVDVLLASFREQLGYATPKVDTRAIVIRDGRVLLVREAEDGLWSLPGGWADVGDQPSVAACREVREETGLEVGVERLLGIWDRNLHGHPPYPFHAYKLFFLCKELGGELQLNADTTAINFFDPAALPPLSLTRVVPIQIETSVMIALTGGLTYCD